PGPPPARGAGGPRGDPRPAGDPPRPAGLGGGRRTPGERFELEQLPWWRRPGGLLPTLTPGLAQDPAKPLGRVACFVVQAAGGGLVEPVRWGLSLGTGGGGFGPCLRGGVSPG